MLVFPGVSTWHLWCIWYIINMVVMFAYLINSIYLYRTFQMYGVPTNLVMILKHFIYPPFYERSHIRFWAGTFWVDDFSLRSLKGNMLIHSLKLTAKAPENWWFEHFLVSFWVKRPILRGKLAVSFREGVFFSDFFSNPPGFASFPGVVEWTSASSLMEHTLAGGPQNDGPWKAGNGPF